ncbi:hypothetical protein BIW11_04354 [Tropilaelaps mercedesae]|uniref:Uncharacterized protein n=1 Tax=Tropilaelaps mercedesae TaxID=418985 RepID=A0A1V9X826_9ACAR|nr:hypothetical protein BIW11_04354 [Tropilaelaps mercedesae]
MTTTTMRREQTRPGDVVFAVFGRLIGRSVPMAILSENRQVERRAVPKSQSSLDEMSPPTEVVVRDCATSVARLAKARRVCAGPAMSQCRLAKPPDHRLIVPSSDAFVWPAEPVWPGALKVTIAMLRKTAWLEYRKSASLLDPFCRAGFKPWCIGDATVEPDSPPPLVIHYDSNELRRASLRLHRKRTVRNTERKRISDFFVVLCTVKTSTGFWILRTELPTDTEIVRRRRVTRDVVRRKLVGRLRSCKCGRQHERHFGIARSPRRLHLRVFAYSRCRPIRDESRCYLQGDRRPARPRASWTTAKTHQGRRVALTDEHSHLLYGGEGRLEGMIDVD